MHNYYPVLISKEAEIDALRRLDQKNKELVAPIIDIIEDGVALPELSKKFKTHWCFDNNRLLFDFFRVNDESKLSDVNGLLRGLSSSGVNAIPVISTGSSAAQKKIVKKYVHDKRSLLGIRISSRHGGFTDLDKTIPQLIRDIETEPNRVLLIFDFGFIEANNIEIITAFTIGGIKLLGKERWGKIIFLSGSFPRDLTEYEVSKTPHSRRRIEETAFTLVKRAVPEITYGDYGIKHPDYIPSMKHSASCSIKYSTKNYFVIYRGQLSKNHEHGNGQYITHSKRLVKSEEFEGENFSWADGEIKRISKEKMTGTSRPGNAKTWVTIGLCHHITLINSLSN